MESREQVQTGLVSLRKAVAGAAVQRDATDAMDVVDAMDAIHVTEHWSGN